MFIFNFCTLRRHIFGWKTSIYWKWRLHLWWRPGAGISDWTFSEYCKKQIKWSKLKCKFSCSKPYLFKICLKQLNWVTNPNKILKKNKMFLNIYSHIVLILVVRNWYFDLAQIALKVKVRGKKLIIIKHDMNSQGFLFYILYIWLWICA